MKKKTVYAGQYMGIHYEIQQRPPLIIDGFPIDKERWTSYIFIDTLCIPEKQRDQFWLSLTGDKHANYDYYKYDVSGLPFHNGCTFYDKEGGPDSKRQYIKVGCDYNHIWDEGHTYYAEGVEREIKEVIDAFRNMVPNYLYWCQGNGKYYYAKEGEFKKNEYFYSNEYRDEIAAEKAKKEEVKS